jgi:hypothetical protein
MSELITKCYLNRFIMEHLMGYFILKKHFFVLNNHFFR